MSSRRLDANEVTSLLKSKEAQDNTKVRAWPNKDDLIRVAKAVSRRDSFVTLTEPNIEFMINYDTRFEAVFLKPHSRYSVFVPCGYFSYSKLKDALTKEEV